MPDTQTPSVLTDEQIVNLNALSQVEAELSSHWQRAAAIEKRYPDRPVPAGVEETELKSVLSTIDKLEARKTQLKDNDQRRSRIFANAEQYSKPAAGAQHMHANGYAGTERKTPGQQFLEHTEYKARESAGLFQSNSTRLDFTVPLQGGAVDWKALIFEGGGFPPSGSGGAFSAPYFVPGLTVPILTRPTTILDIISRSTTTSYLIEYVVETSFVNAANTVPEATATTGTSGSKPESTLTYQLTSAQVKTIATWVPITNRQLADAPALRSLIDTRLLIGLDLALESQIISGDGTGENFLGLLNQPTINIQGRGTDNQQDAIFKGLTEVRVTGLSTPTAIALNPIDFQTIRLARENAATATAGAGSYLMGPPNLAGPTTLWGLPVVQSLGLPVGTALVGAWDTACTLYDREEGNIRIGWINDQFVRNIETILAELRAAFACFRPPAFAKITGL